MTMDAYESEDVYSCSICGRNFVQQSLFKHEVACQKLQKIHRKVFDSGKQRASGSDIPLADIRKAQKEKNKNGGTFPRPKTHWRERHEEFISALSASRGVKETGAPLPPRATVSKDFVKCEYCGRNFNEKAAERHISLCREQHARKPAGSITGPVTAPRASPIRRTVLNFSSQSTLFNKSTVSATHGARTTAAKAPQQPMIGMCSRTPSTPSRMPADHYKTKALVARSRTNSVTRDTSLTRPAAAMSLKKAFVDAATPPIRSAKRTVPTHASSSTSSSKTTVKSRIPSQNRFKTSKHYTVRK